MPDDAPYQSPSRTLRERGLRPRKRFGQNFLVDPRVAERVAARVHSGSFVIEIGGGTGVLTAALAARARALVVLEIDRDLITVLHDRFAGRDTVEIRECDATAFDFRGALVCHGAPRAICGNLPYYVTSPLLERVVESSADWEAAVLMVQREYARRLVASPGSPEYGSLTAFVGYYCTTEKLFDVGAAGFYPSPAVASTVVLLSPRSDRTAGVRDERLLLRTIRAAFAQRRKTLANCLDAAAGDGAARADIETAIRAAGLDPGVRGERLGRDDFRRLANSLALAGIDFP